MDATQVAIRDLEAVEARQVRYVRLRQRNIGHDLAAQTAGSPHGPWRLANSPALQSALPIAYFDSCGLPRLLDVL